MISKRYAKANNPLIPESYNEDEDDTYISYSDISNLYGTAMTFPMPTSNFKWCKEEFSMIMNEIRDRDARETGFGYILEVDLDYPDELHDSHNDLPLAPEKMLIQDNSLSDFQISLRDGTPGKIKKLVPHLMNRDKYIVHWTTLKYYLKKGMILKKVHRILQFWQSAWLKPYIDLNTRMRTNATTAFSRDFYKLMNNSVYGKTMENVWNRQVVKVCWNKRQLMRYSDKSWFRCFQIVNSEISLCIMKQKRIHLNKPLYLGFAILDISKFMFYSNNYDGYKRLWPGEQSELLMVDTDSYIMRIVMPKGRTVYRDLCNIKHQVRSKNSSLELDPSNYDPQDANEDIRSLFDTGNSKKLGALKDEMGSSVIQEFVGLRPKLYALRYFHRTSQHQKELTKAKGCPSNVLKRSFGFNTYKRMLDEGTKSASANITSIRSIRHSINTIVTRKRCITIADDKRHITQNGIDTIAFGHKKLRSY